MCTPQPLQAWRWIGADASTTLSLFAFAVTESLSRGTTATSENIAPSGFQHLLQPHAWLNATFAPSDTVTGLLEHLHVSVPPLKSLVPAFTPLLTDGWMFIAMAFPPRVVERSVGSRFQLRRQRGRLHRRRRHGRLR